MTLEALVDRGLGPLDGLRRATLGAALRHPALAYLVVRRERRLAATATLFALLALLLAVFVPVLLVMLGPVLFGVVHVAADVRYLVLRRQLAPAFKTGLLAGSGALIAVAALAQGQLSRSDGVRAEIVIATLGIGAALLVGAGGARRRLWIGLPLVAAIGAVALSAPHLACMALLHLHNVVGLLLWLWLFRRGISRMALPLAVIGIGAGLLASGALYTVPLEVGPRLLGVHVLEASDWLAPGLRADHAIGLTAAYAFLQSIHYLIWLALIPQDDLPAQGSATFRMSVRGLLADFGRPGVIAIVLLALLVIAGALFDLRGTRHLYLSLAMFHAYLELALVAYYWARGHGLGEPAT